MERCFTSKIYCCSTVDGRHYAHTLDCDLVDTKRFVLSDRSISMAMVHEFVCDEVYNLRSLYPSLHYLVVTSSSRSKKSYSSYVCI